MSSIDPRNTIDNSGTDPNKGLRTRPFLIAVIVAVVVLLLVIIVFVHRSSTAITPQRDTKPKSSLAAPIPSAGICATQPEPFPPGQLLANEVLYLESGTLHPGCYIPDCCRQEYKLAPVYFRNTPYRVSVQ